MPTQGRRHGARIHFPESPARWEQSRDGNLAQAQVIAKWCHIYRDSRENDQEVCRSRGFKQNVRIIDWWASKGAYARSPDWLGTGGKTKVSRRWVSSSQNWLCQHQKGFRTWAKGHSQFLNSFQLHRLRLGHFIKINTVEQNWWSRSKSSTCKCLKLDYIL
jgi:hypothetical protein